MPSDDLQLSVDSVVSGLGELTQTESLTEEQSARLVSALRTTLAVLGGSLGECRQAIPYSPMHPVLGADGVVKWCCNHPVEHCGV